MDKEPARGIKRFVLYRKEDASGTSGTGIVAEGAEFSNGECALVWLTYYKSNAWYANIATLEAIHGHAGRTAIIWEDQTPLAHKEPKPTTQ